MKSGTAAVLLSGLFVLITLGLSGCGSSTQPIVVGLTPSSAKSIDQAQTVTITATVAHDTKAAGVQWTVSGGGMLSAQSTTSAIYTAPASVASAFTATVTATSITDTTRSAALQIKVSPPPTVATTSLAAATAGTAYSATLSEAGGTDPCTWSITSGTLPTGLTLNSRTGVISGMPTGASSAPVTFKVTDATGMTATQVITFTVNPPPALAITTASLSAGTMGTAYSQSLQATGGVPAYTWSVSPGTLPAGLTLSSAGVISGTPSGTFTGTSTFTVTVTDSQTPTAATKTANLSIAVSAPPLNITTTSLAAGTIGNAYSNQTLRAAGGISPYTWAVTTGSLPSGLTLNPATGVISGTPSGTFVGTDNFTVTATDSQTPTNKTATANLSIAISVAPLSVTTSGSLPVGVANSVYAGATLQATGGIQPYSWTVTTGTLPAGLILNAATGAISGTPTASGTTNFTVTVTDAETPTAKTATANLSVVVNPPVSVTTTSLAAGVIGAGYNQTLRAAGGISPYSWAITVGSLPAGLSLNAGTGAITGTPTGPLVGVSSFTVTATDSESPAKTATASLSIIISAATLNVTTNGLPTGVINAAYSGATLQAAGGVSPYTWAVTSGSLPAGLTLTPSGTIAGTPTVLGTSDFTVTATDSETPTAQTASKDLSISINSSTPVGITTTGLPTAIVNVPYTNAMLQANGGTPPYAWSITAGTQPPGLVINFTTGAITGTPTAAGTSNFTVKVTDSTKPTALTATTNLSLTVNGALAITTTTLPGGSVGTAYSSNVQSSGGLGPYTWSVTSGSLPAGLSMNSNGNISGTPTAAATSNFTITVVDNESPQVQVSANLSITITVQACTSTTNAVLNGHYALMINGWKGAGNATTAVGSFVADGAGTISSGNLDVTDQSKGPMSGTFTGTYCVGPNNLATINLTLAAPFQGGATFEAALNSADSNGHIISYDSSSSVLASGLLRKQDTSAFLTSKITGNYAFGMVGADGGGNRFVVAGRFVLNGSGTLSGVYDYDDGGTTGSGPGQGTISASNVSVASTGRGTVTTTSTNGNMNMVFYVVSASELLMMAADTSTPPMIEAGQVLKQSGSFTNASLNGVSVLESQYLNGGATSAASVGLVTATGNAGTLSVTMDTNDGGTMGTQSPYGNFSVESTGRVTLSGAGIGNHPPVFYLVGPNQAFMIGTGESPDFGTLTPQSGSNFTKASLSGNYFGGSQQPVSADTGAEVDSIHSDGNGNLTGTSYSNNSGGPSSSDIVVTYTVSPNGRVVMSQGGVQAVILYIISSSQAVVLPASPGENNPKLIDVHK